MQGEDWQKKNIKNGTVMFYDFPIHETSES